MTQRPAPTKKPSECLHIYIDRLNDDEKKVVLNLNGHGMLMPMLICRDCHQRFYVVVEGPKSKKS